MIKISNLSYSYPKKDLYNKISFTLEDGQHCAFIGSSGNGKSTLVDIIMDPENYMFDGDLTIDINHKIGYVTQFIRLNETEKTTVFEFVGEDFINLQKEIVSICDKMALASEEGLEILMEQYQQALDAFDAMGGDDFEAQINNKLNLAGFGNSKDLSMSDLSGGEVKIIQVIKEMLTSPNLIIMDEPDVFLDFENLNSLRKLINSYKGTLLIITHNRFLLDHCFNKIVHLENMEIQEFDGSYSDYNLSLLESKIERQELSLADDEEIIRNDALINKLRIISSENSDPSRGRALKARMKVQERLENSRIKAPFVEINQPKIKFDTKNNIEDAIALEVKSYDLSFEDTLLENVNFEIKSTDKVALIGSNGTGKTTLLKEIFKNQSDSIRLHPEVEQAYLSQNQGEILDESNTIANEFFDLGFNTLDEIRTFLISYGFKREDLQQKIGSLSGGEKNILQLAKIAYNKADLLLLDEPTSHLDTYAQIALENALQAYSGAVLMISHDYYSIVNSMDYVLIIEDKNIRRMSIKKFRNMIYSSHFDKNYLELETKKKLVETKLKSALQDYDIDLAKGLSEELRELISGM